MMCCTYCTYSTYWLMYTIWAYSIPQSYFIIEVTGRESRVATQQKTTGYPIEACFLNCFSLHERSRAMPKHGQFEEFPDGYPIIWTWLWVSCNDDWPSLNDILSGLRRSLLMSAMSFSFLPATINKVLVSYLHIIVALQFFVFLKFLEVLDSHAWGHGCCADTTGQQGS